MGILRTRIQTRIQCNVKLQNQLIALISPLARAGVRDLDLESSSVCYTHSRLCVFLATWLLIHPGALLYSALDCVLE